MSIIPHSNKIDTTLRDPLIFKKVFLECETGLILIDTDACLLNWNPWFSRHSGLDLEKSIGINIFELFPILQKSSVERAIHSALINKLSSVVSHSLNRKPFPLVNSAGNPLHQYIIVKPFYLKNNTTYCLIQINDISASVNREKQLIAQTKTMRTISDKLAQEIERAQVTLDSIADAVITTDESANILSMNPVAEILTGFFVDDVRGQHVDHVFKLIHEKSSEPIPSPVMLCLERQDIIANENDHILLSASGEHFSITDSVAPIIDEDNKVLGSVLVFRDVTHSRILSAELNWQALHDPLTGLANRRQFEASLKVLLKKAKLDNLTHHLLYMDLDQFKIVNDTCGHDAGDELLKQITDTLANKLRKTDLLARLGGDEFGVLLESCDADHALTVANILRQAVENFRFSWQTHSFRIGVSIGIAEITGQEAKTSDVLSAADAACYVAKESGRNRVHFHSPEGSASSDHQQEMQWISRLQAALDNNKFELYLQRIQDTKQTAIHSNHYEVLLRMIGEKGELIPPGAFLPAAERFNLISSLDTWVVQNVFKKLKQLKNNINNPEQLLLSINLSGASMMSDELLRTINQLLDKSTYPAGSFCFEVTETATIANLKKATVFLSELRSKGCKIALDDFGSGLSSFAYLKELPIDYLKIDGYFVKDIAIDKINKAFVESINQIGHVMNLETIAEFVENEDILEILTGIGVNYAQGYGIHKPCPFDEIFKP